ncbi:MAG: hypothetical protein Q3988_01150 [Gemella sp.]|nr:hypothetical protein [Gemella sp.]
MKKILTLSALAVVLTGCTSEPVKSKPVNVESTTSGSKESTSKENSNSSNNTSVENTSSTKVDTIDYAAAEEILKLYFGTKVIPDLFTFSDKFGEKLDRSATLSHKVSVAKLVDVYNALERGTVSKEDAIKKFANGAGDIAVVDSNFDLTKAKELVGSSVNKVVYFTGDETVFAYSNGGVGAMGGLEAAERSEWKVEGDTIVVPTIMQPGNTRGETVRLKANNKSYSGGASKYKYYVDVQGKAATGSLSKVSAPKKETTTTTKATTKVETTQTKAAPKGNGLSAYAGTYVGSNGSTITISSSGEFIVDGEAMAVDVESSGGSLSLMPSNWKSNMNPPSYTVEKGKVIAQFRGSMVEYRLK